MGYALVLNAGSSSLKFCVYDAGVQPWPCDARGQIDGIGSRPRFSARAGTAPPIEESLPATVRDVREALTVLATWLRTRYAGAPVLAVGHRVVHGGARYARPALVTPEVLADLRALEPLAPLHQPYNLDAIETAAARLPGVPQVACFDTSFHRTQPEIATVVPLPQDLLEGGVQRYGFHGLSYEYIASVLPRAMPDIAEGRIIVAHLGSGASMCALKGRKSVDSTLGFTALDGLCMGTRPGAVDPGVILYLFQRLGLSAADVETILYRKSGLLGISGVSNDMRELLASDAPRAKLAVDYFVYRAAKEIGALAAVLGGVDAIVFTGGIGQNSREIRRRICAAAAWLGVELDAAADGAGALRITHERSRVAAWVIPTDEELMIARHTAAALGIAHAA